jgi:hypothetical protein
MLEPNHCDLAPALLILIMCLIKVHDAANYLLFTQDADTFRDHEVLLNHG